MSTEPTAIGMPGSELAALLQLLGQAEAALSTHLVEADSPGQHGATAALRAVGERLRATVERLQKQVDLQTAIIEALPSHIALVGADGVITAVNAAWRRFAAANHLPDPACGVGQHYLLVCERERHDQPTGAQVVGIGLRRVLEGQLQDFTHEYPCHAQNERRWFLLTITPLSAERRVGAVIAHTNITERKIAEIALQESEMHFRTTFEQAAVGVAHVAADGRFHQVNERLCAMLGFTNEELCRQTFAELSFPDCRALAEAARQEMLAGNQSSYSAEMRYRRKNGEALWVNLVTTVVRRQSQPPYFISVLEDITARRTGDLRLQRINRLYLVLSKIGAAIVKAKKPAQLYGQVCRIMVDDGRFRIALIAEAEPDDEKVRTIAVAGETGDYLNSFINSQEQHGVHSNGPLGTALRSGRYDVCNDFTQDPRMASWQAAAATNHLRAAAAFPLAADGVVTTALVLFSEEVDYFREDEIALMVAVGDNISFALDAMLKERLRIAVERSLRDSERRFRALSDQSADGISLIDANNHILYLSPSVATIEGYSPAELVGRQGLENTHPDDVPFVQRTIAELLASPGKPVPVLWRRRHKDGHWLWLEGISTNLLNDPAVSAIVTNYRDVTERKSAEAELQHSQGLLRMASRLGRIGAWTLEVPTLTVTWSDEIKEIHEVPGDFVPVIDCALDFYPPEHRPQITSAVDACLREGQPFDVELQIITAKGRRVWVRSIGEAVRDQRGTITRIQGAFQDISERRQAAEDHRLIAERLTTTLESITEAFYTIDRDWRFTYVNQQAELILRRHRRALIGRVIWDEFPEFRETTLRRRVEQAMHDNASVQFQDHHAPFDAWYDIRIYPSAQGLAIYISDITEQQRAREAVRISEERFRLLAKATNDAIWDWNVVRNDLWWNEGLETLFGYGSEEVDSTLEFWSTRIHPEDQRRVTDSVDHAIRTGAQVWSQDYRFRHKDGSYAYVTDRGHLIRDAAGQAIRMIGGMNDLTARKRADERIAEQAALLDEARDAISVRDLRHHTTYMNKGAERVYGWTAAEVMGRSFRDLVYKDPTAFNTAIAAVLEHGEWIGELSPINKAGQQLLIEARWSLVRDHAGQPSAILSICTDISEKRKIEKQFLRAQRLESIGTLAGGIAHDLNNVLTPILLSINLLMTGETDKRRLRTLSIIDASAQRGADMVKQVLSFARGVEGQRLPVDIRQLIRDIEKVINDTFLKNIQVRTAIDPEIDAVIGDVTQIHQVLLNLCVNARDAMPDGGALTLSAENVVLDEHYARLNVDAKAGSYVLIRIEDTGTGIPTDIMEKIFEPFFTTKDIDKGTGLGLSTSLAVARSHGGFMRVYSEPGRGSTFTLYLPSVTAASAGVSSREGLALPRGNGELILVVDDEEAVRQLTRQILEAFGYRVLLAIDGSDAIALFAVQQHDISLVLTDMMMPIMDGNAVIRVLMKLRPDVRLIAASGLHENHVVAKAMSGGVKHFLTKPYTAESLLVLIRKALTAT